MAYTLLIILKSHHYHILIVFLIRFTKNTYEYNMWYIMMDSKTPLRSNRTLTRMPLRRRHANLLFYKSKTKTKICNRIIIVRFLGNVDSTTTRLYRTCPCGISDFSIVCVRSVLDTRKIRLHVTHTNDSIPAIGRFTRTARAYSNNKFYPALTIAIQSEA